MAAGSDLLDDLFADVAVKTARPVGKFQPKAKFKPARKNSAATSISSSAANQSSDNAPSKSTEPVKNAEPSDNNDPRPVSLSHVKDSSKVIGKANASLQPNLDMVTEQHESSYAHTEKSAGENADTVIHLESLDDLVLQGTTTDMEGAVPRSDVVSVYVPNPENTRGSDVPVISDSTYTNNVPEVLTCLQVLEEGDPITASRCEGGVSLNDRECEREEMSVMYSIDFSELTTTPVQKTGKFQPKRKVQMRKEVPVISSMESGPTPPEINSAEKDSVPDFVGDDDDDDVLDLSSIGLTDGAPTEETSEPPLNEEESMNLMEYVPEFPAKLVSRRAKIGTSEAHVASNVSMQQQNARPSGQDNEITDRVLRPRKNKISFCELDEAEDVDNRPASSAAEEDNYDDEQFEQESESKVKKMSRKSRKPDEDIEKPSKKREKAKEALDGKPKKFFRSTRRSRVDKALLETPEDEIDYQQVPLRDLIRLAEHKEKQMNKEEAAAKPAIKQSNGNSSAFHYENETYTSREDEENNDEQENPTVQDMYYFNYMTYMDKTPTIRWSKQDTELFYEAVRQFGTDLSMIQHLFPGRTRHQIKLKYKKEEKQNPFRLHDAMTTRTNDVSHFQKVIDRLKQIAAEEKQNADEDESMGLSGDDEVAEEETSLANDEEAKNEEIEREENEDVPQDVVQETGNPEEAYDSDEDMLLWSQYKSNT